MRKSLIEAVLLVLAALAMAFSLPVEAKGHTPRAPKVAKPATPRVGPTKAPHAPKASKTIGGIEATPFEAAVFNV